MKYIHNWPDTDIDIWNFSEMMHNFPSLSYTEVLQQYYSQQAEKSLWHKQYGLYRNCKFYMAEASKNNGDFENALAFLFEVVYYDFSALNNFPR